MSFNFFYKPTVRGLDEGRFHAKHHLPDLVLILNQIEKYQMQNCFVNLPLREKGERARVNDKSKDPRWK